MKNFWEPTVSRLETLTAEGGQVTDAIPTLDDSLAQRTRDAKGLHDATPRKGVRFE
jgi:hypothetical protein